MFEFKSFATEYLSEGSTAGIAPFGFMVTQHYVVFHFQQVETLFYFFHGGAVALFGNVACYQYEIDAVGCINLCNGTQ